MESVSSPEAADFEKAWALSILGRAALTEGRFDEAEANLREALRLSGPEGSGRSGLEEAWLGDVALAKGSRADLEAAYGLLERRAADPPLIVSARFTICLTLARLASALDDQPSAASWARLALELADRTDSGLANHRTVGLVAIDPDLRARLEATTANA